MRTTLLLLFLFILVSCDNETLPELEENLFDATNGNNSFAIENVEFEFYSTSKRNVLMNFSSNFLQLNKSQQNQIEFINISEEGNFSLVNIFIPPTRTFIFDGEQDVGNVCYLFKYITFSGAATTIEKHCIDVQ